MKKQGDTSGRAREHGRGHAREHGRVRGTSILFGLSITIGSIVVMLVLLEAGLRVAGWRRSFEIVERVERGIPRRLGIRTLHANSVIHHETREFDVTYRSNSLGYYDREWSRNKAPGTFRIAFFGDSFTMGHGVGSEHAFPRLLEAKLSQRTGRNVETMNFGVWGSGTLDEREYLSDALALGVDHVVICFYINDVFDNVRYRNEEAKGEAYTAGDELQTETASGHQRMLMHVREALNNRSRAFAFIMERTKNLRDALGLVTYPLEGVFTGRSNSLIEEAARYLDETADDLGARRVALTVVYLPAKVQISPVRVPGNFDLDLPNRILADKLTKAPLIDLTQEFRSVDVAECWFREGHYNERGHSLVAGWLAAGIPLGD